MDISLRTLRMKYPRINSKKSSSMFKQVLPEKDKSESLRKIKEILERCIEPTPPKPQFIESKVKITRIISKTQNQDKNSMACSKSSNMNERAMYFDAMKIHCKSPGLKLKKLKSRASSHRNDSSLIVQKLSYSKLSQQKHLQPVTKMTHRKRNSSYSSYSDIIKGLLEKIPLAN